MKDNTAFGSMNWESIIENWEQDELGDWGVELLGLDVDGDSFGEEFKLESGEKSNIEQITFTLAAEQGELIRSCLKEAKGTKEFKYMETLGNENGNGNALYFIMQKWKETNN